MEPCKGHVHGLCELLIRGISPEVHGQLPADSIQTVHGLHHVDRNADRPCLVCNGSCDGLPDPPGRVGREFESLPELKLVHSLDQAHVALLDEIQEGHAVVDVLLGNGYHKAQIRLGQGISRIIPVRDKVSEFPLVLSGNEGDLLLVLLLPVILCALLRGREREHAPHHLLGGSQGVPVIPREAGIQDVGSDVPGLHALGKGDLLIRL